MVKIGLLEIYINVNEETMEYSTGISLNSELIKDTDLKIEKIKYLLEPIAEYIGENV